jgi:hypothetical protein
LKSPRNDTGIAMTNLHRSPPMNQSKTDLGIVNESQLLRFGISYIFCGLVSICAVRFSAKQTICTLDTGIYNAIAFLVSARSSTVLLTTEAAE